jgi:hypothetical protein
VFILELSAGDALVIRWSLNPADFVAGRHWLTILSSMSGFGSMRARRRRR